MVGLEEMIDCICMSKINDVLHGWWMKVQKLGLFKSNH